MKKETAVEWFANTLSKAGLITQDDFDSLVKQAKEMEAKEMYSKEEVIEAHALGMDYYAEPNDWDKVTPKQKLENLLNKKQ
jgi:hypothetical protein